MNRMASVLAGLVAVPVIGAGIAYVEPRAGATVPPAVTPCFAPEQNCSAVVVQALNAAEATALAGAYALTEPRIIQAMVAAKGRGVDIELIVDRGVPCELHSGVPALAQAGIPIWVDSKVRLAHWKVVVIDGHLVVAGSYNFSVAAAHNSEDLITIESADIANAFAEHWRTRRDASTPYQLREDWCPAAQTQYRTTPPPPPHPLPPPPPPPGADP